MNENIFSEEVYIIKLIMKQTKFLHDDYVEDTAANEFPIILRSYVIHSIANDLNQPKLVTLEVFSLSENLFVKTTGKYWNFSLDKKYR